MIYSQFSAQSVVKATLPQPRFGHAPYRAVERKPFVVGLFFNLNNKTKYGHQLVYV